MLQRLVEDNMSPMKKYKRVDSGWVSPQKFHQIVSENGDS